MNDEWAMRGDEREKRDEWVKREKRTSAGRGDIAGGYTAQMEKMIDDRRIITRREKEWSDDRNKK